MAGWLGLRVQRGHRAFGVWLTRGQELVVATEPELFPEELDVLDPVDHEPAHVVTQPIPDEHLPNGDVVVEVLQLDLPLGESACWSWFLMVATDLFWEAPGEVHGLTMIRATDASSRLRGATPQPCGSIGASSPQTVTVVTDPGSLFQGGRARASRPRGSGLVAAWAGWSLPDDVYAGQAAKDEAQTNFERCWFAV